MLPTPALTQDALYATRNALYAITGICDAAFATYDRTAYDQIERKLEGMEACPEVDEMRAFCKAGATMMSPRFGYPHIADAARRMRERLCTAEAPAAGGVLP